MPRKKVIVATIESENLEKIYHKVLNQSISNAILRGSFLKKFKPKKNKKILL